MAEFKLYHASWYRTFLGYPVSHDVVVVAETESVALGTVLMDYPELDKEYWNFEEIDMSFRHSHNISSHEG